MKRSPTGHLLILTCYLLLLYRFKSDFTCAI